MANTEEILEVQDNIQNGVNGINENESNAGNDDRSHSMTQDFDNNGDSSEISDENGQETLPEPNKINETTQTKDEEARKLPSASQSNHGNEEAENAEEKVLTKEKDTLKMLIAEREMYDYLMSDLRKLRRVHQYMDKSVPSNNPRAQQLKAEIHKLHLLYQEYEEMDRDPDFEMATLKQTLSNMTAELDGIQRSVESTRVDVLKQELKDLDESLVKLKHSVMEDRIKHAEIQQQLAMKHLKRMQELKDQGVKLEPKQSEVFWRREDEERTMKEELQRKRYQQDLVQIRSRSQSHRNGQYSNYLEKLKRDESSGNIWSSKVEVGSKTQRYNENVRGEIYPRKTRRSSLASDDSTSTKSNTFSHSDTRI